ncbi:DNA-directed RNA polymerase subunit M [Thermoproteus tenax]|uniref:DNA-directed RNA polymerase subunit M n=1 Tax=Thermoproteus tenax (strain ATCC 35583 / DSM 2078 / JCM 9277 / NBRC 100435 / Kra 1) TaxID=768679 RepID=G4RLR7_THETK|nr:DNA-directed RNA polymerase subunit M [Thermoproteus tenax]CCC82512.1 putative DNA-directed RNA polymerase subunit M [Thermoproteus tenax Kra 1]
MSCPKCGSKAVKVTSSGKYLCTTCGYTWPIPEAQLGWAIEIFQMERAYEELKDAKNIDCAKLKEEIKRRGLDDEKAAKIARRVLRRAIKLSGDHRAQEELGSALKEC